MFHEGRDWETESANIRVPHTGDEIAVSDPLTTIQIVFGLHRAASIDVCARRLVVLFEFVEFVVTYSE